MKKCGLKNMYIETGRQNQSCLCFGCVGDNKCVTCNHYLALLQREELFNLKMCNCAKCIKTR